MYAENVIDLVVWSYLIHKKHRPFEILQLYNVIVWELWMEPSGILVAIYGLLVTIPSAQTMPLYNARILNGLSCSIHAP